MLTSAMPIAAWRPAAWNHETSSRHPPEDAVPSLGCAVNPVVMTAQSAGCAAVIGIATTKPGRPPAGRTAD